ncbi:MAG: hypothetical protein AAF191_01700 [Verrucomicrobiota bacterium]
MTLPNNIKLLSDAAAAISAGRLLGKVGSALSSRSWRAFRRSANAVGCWGASIARSFGDFTNPAGTLDPSYPRVGEGRDRDMVIAAAGVSLGSHLMETEPLGNQEKLTEGWFT